MSQKALEKGSLLGNTGIRCQNVQNHKNNQIKVTTNKRNQVACYSTLDAAIESLDFDLIRRENGFTYLVMETQDGNKFYHINELYGVDYGLFNDCIYTDISTDEKLIEEIRFCFSLFEDENIDHLDDDYCVIYD